jgi:hypothetical protein
MGHVCGLPEVDAVRNCEVAHGCVAVRVTVMADMIRTGYLMAEGRSGIMLRVLLARRSNQIIPLCGHMGPQRALADAGPTSAVTTHAETQASVD